MKRALQLGGNVLKFGKIVQICFFLNCFFINANLQTKNKFSHSLSLSPLSYTLSLCPYKPQINDPAKKREKRKTMKL